MVLVSVPHRAPIIANIFSGMVQFWSDQLQGLIEKKGLIVLEKLT
jgi:hypothetical protein